MNRRKIHMEIVVIDTFVVPDESRPALLETSRAIQHVLKALPGFVEGFVYVKKAGEGRHSVVTTAVWKDENAFENARKAVPGRLQALGINPQEAMKGLNVQIERAMYTRSPY
jgi:heme-degrading monooxygenase HmoA